MMRILITGAAGFVGSHTADLLLTDGHKVLGLDNFSTGSAENLKSFCEQGGELEQADITKLFSIVSLVKSFKPDAIIHLAAQPSLLFSEQYPFDDLRTNVLGTLNVLTAAKEFGIKRFVFSSTSAVYEEQKHPSTYHEDYPLVPNSSYGVSKASAEMYVRKNIPNHAILRYGNVFGPRQVPLGENQLIARAIRHFVEGTEFQINGDGEQSRDFVYVQDVAQANALAVTYENISGTFNISMGEAISVNAILGLLEQVYEVPGYPWEHNDHTELRKHIKLSVTEAYKKLGWRASPSLLDGLRITAQWWKGYVNA